MKPLEVNAYEIFKDKFGQENAETIVQFIGNKSIFMFETHKDTLATKVDLKEVESRLQNEIAGLRIEFSEFRGEIKEALASTKADILKWSFVFWIGTCFSFLGCLVYLVKLIQDK